MKIDVCREPAPPPPPATVTLTMTGAEFWDLQMTLNDYLKLERPSHHYGTPRDRLKNRTSINRLPVIATILDTLL